MRTGRAEGPYACGAGTHAFAEGRGLVLAGGRRLGGHTQNDQQALV